jgi:anti-sigma factor RsiW
MNCQEVRSALDESFDRGEARSAEVETHLADCAGCRTYAAQLEAINGALFSISVEEMEPSVLNAIHQALVPERTILRLRPAILAVAGVTLSVCAVLFAWQYGFILDHAESGWNRILTLFSVQGVIDTNQTLSAALANIADWAGQSLDPISGIAPAVRWAAAIAAGGAVVLLNGFEFWRLRIAGGGRS